MDQNISFVGKTSWVSVSISRRDRGDLHPFRGNKGASVADFRTLFNPFHISHVRDQLHCRPERNCLLIDFIWRIQSIGRNPGSLQIHSKLWHINDTCTVCTVIISKFHTFCCKMFFHPQKSTDLFQCRGLIRLICLWKMGKHSFAIRINKSADLKDLLYTFFRYRKAKSWHSCIDLNVQICLLPHTVCGLIRKLRKLIAVGCHADLMTDHLFQLVRENTSQAKNRLLNAGFSEYNTFIQSCDRIAPDIVHIF